MGGVRGWYPDSGPRDVRGNRERVSSVNTPHWAKKLTLWLQEDSRASYSSVIWICRMVSSKKVIYGESSQECKEKKKRKWVVLSHGGYHALLTFIN